MSIATKQLAKGVLAENVTGPNYVPVSHSSDWFESNYGSDPDEANAMTVAVSIEKVDRYWKADPEHEELYADLLESDDLIEWSRVTTLLGTMRDPKLYSVSWDYGGARKKYFRLQFNLNLSQLPLEMLAIPYPTHTVRFEGTCWVTVYRKRP